MWLYDAGTTLFQLSGISVSTGRKRQYLEYQLSDKQTAV